MKKNLIGIVAAGLALALAFTGCESGSDSPVKYATDLDNPVTKGSKFTYVANPTSYDTTGHASQAETETGKLGTATAGYSYNKYVDGSQSYNIVSGDWGKVDTSSIKAGDVVNTLQETIVLNSKDNTFEYSKTSTAYAVKQIVFVETTPDAQSAYYVISKASSSTTIEDTITALASTADTAKTTLEAKEVAWRAAGSPASGTEKEAVDAAKAAKTTADEKLAIAQYYKEGARWAVLSTKTVDGAKTGSEKFYKEDKKTLVTTVDKKDGTAKTAAKGTYKLSGSSYKEGTALITSLTEAGGDTYVFNDDGTYTVKGVLKVNPADTDFPEVNDATHADPSNRLFSGHRKLVISGGVITTPRRRVTAAGTGVLVDNNGFFLSSSWASAEAAWKDSQKTAAKDTKDLATSYSYKLSN